MDKLLMDYRYKFGENFPIMMMMSETEENIIKIIEECIKNNKPYDVKRIDGANY